MNRPGFIPLWLVLLASWLAAAAVQAHDTGLLTLKFEELDAGRYRIDYLARPGTPESAALPVLPEHCTWEEEPPLPGGFMRLYFATDGKPLSAEDRILLPWKKNGVLVHAFWRSGESARLFCSPEEDGIPIRIGRLRAGAGSLKEAAARYTRLGLESFLLGADHLLFLAGLLMLAKKGKALACALAAFAVSAGVSLVLSAAGGGGIPAALAGVLAALGILYLAAEILRARARGGDPGIRRLWFAALLFGFAHGPGLAGALLDLGLPGQDLPGALLFFICGTLAGLLLFVSLWRAVLAAARQISLRLPDRAAWAPAYLLGIAAACSFLDRTLIRFS